MTDATNLHTDITRLYALLDDLHRRLGGYQYLKNLDGSEGLPRRGVYFFFEVGEKRHGGHADRVTHIGAHGLEEANTGSLWKRLLNHKGDNDDIGGDHRRSALRRRIGMALLARHPHGLKEKTAETWPLTRKALKTRDAKKIRHDEKPLEAEVSSYIRNMPLLWLAVGDKPSPHSHRGVIQNNAVRLLSDARAVTLDPPSKGWLGHDADDRKVRNAGLWSVRDAGRPYDPRFLDLLAACIDDM